VTHVLFQALFFDQYPSYVGEIAQKQTISTGFSPKAILVSLKETATDELDPMKRFGRLCT
jgi:hypothetical protein